jgi:predicted RNase H-like nuclease
VAGAVRRRALPPRNRCTTREADLNAVFARYDAGAHPSNTGKPEFADGTRGARIAAHLGLDIDPASTSDRRAIEVYPHPATIALFGLDRTIKYKHKPGRDLAFLRAESVRLIEYLEGLAHADPGLHVRDNLDWQSLRAQVRRGSRKSEIRAVEDRIDAMLCAYIASYAATRPDDVTVFGDVENGYIVTPTLPDSAPLPLRTLTRGRASRLTDEDVLLRYVGS